MQRKWIMIFCIAAMFLLSIWGINEFFNHQEQNRIYEVKWKSKIALNEIQGLSDEEITHRLFEKYLLNPSPQGKLKEYKIESIKERCYYYNEKIFLIHFHVYPENSFGWIAGNGSPKENGWIVNKYLYITMIKEKGYAQMRIRGTDF